MKSKSEIDSITETVKYGDLFEWNESEHGPCMLTYSGLVSLKNPKHTWDNDQSIWFVKDRIIKGELKKLPIGFKFTVYQD